MTLDSPAKKLTISLWTTYISLGVFLGLIFCLNIISAHSNYKIALIKILPLAILLPGLLRKKYRSYSWLCFVILPYFIFITPALFGPAHWSNWLEILLTVIIFIASMMTSRWLQDHQFSDMVDEDISTQ